jgi:thiamine biosynthesis lipoprotein
MPAHTVHPNILLFIFYLVLLFCCLSCITQPFKFMPYFLIVLLLLFTSCQKATSPSPTLFSQNIMTIDYRILIGDRLTPSQLKEIQFIIDETFHEIDRVYNKWNSDSELSHLNRLKAGEVKLLSPALYSFMRKVDSLVRLSHGLFDPTIEPLAQLWKTNLELNQEPSPEEIENLKTCIGWDKIHFSNGVFYKEDQRTQLDFGGVAKGYCVDLLAERLSQAGFKNLYVEWGGEIRAMGSHPSKRPWSIYIRGLQDRDPAHALARLNMSNQSIATSGDYYQQWTIETANGPKTYCHIFNPKTLSPVVVQEGSVASASLTANDCLTADALAKVLMLFASEEKAIEWLDNLPLPNLHYWMAIR